ncbi:MAG: hypothetical protein IJ689_04725 [Alphaproteobacteria bacterium]|nr:hypothetical protein [Alphaproteobacteria bacterium]
MKNYILLIGIAGVALGSYAAYASNSATMTVTATIAHDVSLNVTQDLDFGTITINPAYTGSDTQWNYLSSGPISYEIQGAITSADNITFGTFIANIPNPSVCTGNAPICGGLSITGNNGNEIRNIFGGSNTNYCDFNIKYSGSERSFIVDVNECLIRDVSQVTTGTHTGTLTISYNAE